MLVHALLGEFVRDLDQDPYVVRGGDSDYNVYVIAAA